jgi:hypothetical protein
MVSATVKACPDSWLLVYACIIPTGQCCVLSSPMAGEGYTGSVGELGGRWVGSDHH